MITTLLWDFDQVLLPYTDSYFSYLKRHWSEIAAEMADIPYEFAEAKAMEYYMAHGTALHGFVEEYGLDRDDLFHRVHDTIDTSSLKGLIDPIIPQLEKHCEGHKNLIFSHNSASYVHRAAAELGLGHIFSPDSVYGLDSVDYHFKKDKKSYEILLKKENLSALEVEIIEDTKANLASAKELGMKTVWLNVFKVKNCPDYVDEEYSSLKDYLTRR